MSKVIILHAYMNTPKDHWYPWLAEDLKGRGYEVQMPVLPGGEEPKMAEQMKTVAGQCEIDKNTTIVTHSLGCLLGLRLAEKYKFKKLILVSGWDFNSLAPYEQTFWQTGLDRAKLIRNTLSRVVVTSDNDPWIGPDMAREIAERIDARYVLIPGAGHFRLKDGYLEFPEMSKIVKDS